MPVTINGTGTAVLPDASGNVGIGTSSPVTRLDLVGIATVRNNSAAWNTTPNTNYGLNFQAASTGTCHITTYSSGGNTELAFATNSGGGAATEQARIKTDGSFQFNSGYGSVATAYGCRAWVNFNGTGTVAIRASGNVSSISDFGTGQYGINMATAMPDTNYAAFGFGRPDDDANDTNLGLTGGARNAQTTSQFRVITKYGNAVTTIGQNADFAYVFVTVFR